MDVRPLGSSGFQESESTLGFQFGGGFAVRSNRGLLYGAGLKVHRAFADRFIDTDFVTLQLGVAFDR